MQDVVPHPIGSRPRVEELSAAFRYPKDVSGTCSYFLLDVGEHPATLGLDLRDDSIIVMGLMPCHESRPILFGVQPTETYGCHKCDSSGPKPLDYLWRLEDYDRLNGLIGFFEEWLDVYGGLNVLEVVLAAPRLAKLVQLLARQQTPPPHNREAWDYRVRCALEGLKDLDEAGPGRV